MNRIPAMGFTFLFALLVVGCKPNDPKSKMRQATAEYTAATELLATIRDKATFEAAKPKLKKHCAWVREQNRENQAMQKQKGNGNPQDLQAGVKELDKLSNEPEFKQMWDAIMRYSSEMLRVQFAVPEFTEFYKQETQP